MKNVTMKDIAEKLGVSVVAVSKALHNKEGVSEALRAKIFRTANEMGYRYNARTALPEERLSHNIAVVVAERFFQEDSFYFKYFKCISAILQEQGYYSVYQALSWHDEQGLVFPQAYRDGNVDAFIILGQICKDYSRLLTNTGLPVVCLDFYDDQSGVDCIIGNSFYASYEITNYLIGYEHRKIAFVGNIRSTSSIQDRYLGYYKSLLEHGIPLKNEYVIPDRDGTGSYIELELPREMPTAFVCNCDEIACRLIAKLQEMGYKVPEDISVVGFDNSVYSTISTPQITTVEVSIEEMSKLAVSTILKKINNPSYTCGRIHINGRIIYRNSVAKAAQI